MLLLTSLIVATGTALQVPRGGRRARGGGGAPRRAAPVAAALPLVPVAEALASGPLGVPALAAVAGSVLAPLTLYRQGYSFSVGRRPERK